MKSKVQGECAGRPVAACACAQAQRARCSRARLPSRVVEDELAEKVESYQRLDMSFLLQKLRSRLRAGIAIIVLGPETVARHGQQEGQRATGEVVPAESREPAIPHEEESGLAKVVEDWRRIANEDLQDTFEHRATQHLGRAFNERGSCLFLPEQIKEQSPRSSCAHSAAGMLQGALPGQLGRRR